MVPFTLRVPSSGIRGGCPPTLPVMVAALVWPVTSMLGAAQSISVRVAVPLPAVKFRVVESTLRPRGARLSLTCSATCDVLAMVL